MSVSISVFQYIADQEFIPVPLIPNQYHSILSGFFLFLISSSLFWQWWTWLPLCNLYPVTSAPSSCRDPVLSAQAHAGPPLPYSSSADMKNSSHSLADACFAQPWLMAFVLNHARRKERKKLTYLKPFFGILYIVFCNNFSWLCTIMCLLWHRNWTDGGNWTDGKCIVHWC